MDIGWDGKAFTQDWTTNGYHDGGVAYGQNYCITWQRGAVNTAGRNGAFLLEIMQACLDYVDSLLEPDGTPIIAHSLQGAMIVWGTGGAVLAEVLQACHGQYAYYAGHNPQFDCIENQRAMKALAMAIPLAYPITDPDCLDVLRGHIWDAVRASTERKQRRLREGTAGTSIGTLPEKQP